MENFQKNNKRAGLNKRAGWNISRKINKRADLNKGAGRDNELNTMRFLVPGAFKNVLPVLTCNEAGGISFRHVL